MVYFFYKDGSDSVFGNLQSVIEPENVVEIMGLSDLTSLRGLENFSALTKLQCIFCDLTSLRGLENCTALTELECSENRLTSLEGLENCTALTKLVCRDNDLTSLRGLENCTALTELDCSGNRLPSLEGLQNCTALTKLDCSINNLAILPEFIVNFRRLQTFDFIYNQIEYIPLQVQRFLERVKNRQTSVIRVYSDGQNVHNSAIVNSIKASLSEILSEKVVKYDI
jgi:Leucine-rich repeat (LRR) protein